MQRFHNIKKLFSNKKGLATGEDTLKYSPIINNISRNNLPILNFH